MELVVLGAGPAGLTAAIQARRMGLEPLVVDRDQPGGFLRTAWQVENYPGFPGPVPGERVADLIVRQAARLGVHPLAWEVERITPAEDGYRLTGGGREEHTRALIVATGSQSRRLDVPGEAELAGSRLFYRADRLLEAGPAGRVAVVGGGEAALDQALRIAEAGGRPTVLMRGERSRALASQLEAARRRGIPLLPGRRLVRLALVEEEVLLFPEEGEREAPFRADKVLVTIGKKPDTALLPGAVLDERGTPQAGPDGSTALAGLFLAGDLRRGPDRQTAIAVGDGMAAALAAVRYLGRGDPSCRPAAAE